MENMYDQCRVLEHPNLYHHVTLVWESDFGLSDPYQDALHMKQELAGNLIKDGDFGVREKIRPHMEYQFYPNQQGVMEASYQNSEQTQHLLVHQSDLEYLKHRVHKVNYLFQLLQKDRLMRIPMQDLHAMVNLLEKDFER